MTQALLTASQKRALDWQKENLVLAAEVLLSEGDVVHIPKNKLGDSQLRNLMAIAGETESPAVVTNFIRYQMGRDSKNKECWARLGHTGLPFGELLIHAIDKGAVKEAIGKVEGLEGPALQVARMQMVRHFLGFMSRHLKYLAPQRPSHSKKGGH